MTDAIGIRELRQHASRYVARCRNGESFVVTDRGNAVGLLASGWTVIHMHASELIDALVASGRYPTRAAALREAVDDLVREMERERVDAEIVAGYERIPAAETVDDWGDLGSQVDSAALETFDGLDPW